MDLVEKIYVIDRLMDYRFKWEVKERRTSIKQRELLMGYGSCTLYDTLLNCETMVKFYLCQIIWWIWWFHWIPLFERNTIDLNITSFRQEEVGFWIYVPTHANLDKSASTSNEHPWKPINTSELKLIWRSSSSIIFFFSCFIDLFAHVWRRKLTQGPKLRVTRLI